MAMTLSGKLITGASRGIGKNVADAFAREGVRLSLVGDIDEEGLRQTPADIRQSGTEPEDGLFDVGSYDEVKRMADAIARRYGSSIW
jgi:NAD(P)-dependent dehydrogenase (short-subunit alcohol dehydrogenase family)